MNRKPSTANSAPKYGIFRGNTYAVPVCDYSGTPVYFDTLDDARAALPAMQSEEDRFAARWGYTAPTFLIQGCNA